MIKDISCRRQEGCLTEALGRREIDIVPIQVTPKGTDDENGSNRP